MPLAGIKASTARDRLEVALEMATLSLTDAFGSQDDVSSKFAAGSETSAEGSRALNSV